MSEEKNRFLVLVNPLSHGGRCGRRLAKLQALLTEGEFVVTDDISEARRRAREASGYETIVACGGDGTVNAVAAGVLENPDPALKFGVLYQGTSPDFCREHGIPTIAEAAVDVLRKGEVREIPVLAANGSKANSLATFTSRALLPEKGPRMPAASSWSMMRPARL